MSRSLFSVRSFVHLCLLGLLATGWQAHAATREECEQQFKAERGQLGKDVVWIPTNDALVTRMLQMANVTATDRVYDLGAGDGKIAIAAAKQFGAKAVGVEYDEQLAKLGSCFAGVAGVADRVRIVQGDIFETDFSDATVVTLYLLPELNLRLRPTILKMQPGTRVVSHSFLMEEWQPDDRSMTEDGSAYLWIVPASVDGTWVFRRKGGSDDFSVQLKQSFQHIEGTAGRRNSALTDVRLSGNQIGFAFSDGSQPVRLDGQVEGDRIAARVTRSGKTVDYVGTRR